MRRVRIVELLALWTIGAAGFVAPAAGQTPPPAVRVGFGIDTTAADVGPIVRLVRTYLMAADSASRARLWYVADRSDPMQRDLAGRYARQGFPATVVSVIPTDRGDSVYVVKLLYAAAAARGGVVSPMALERFYAVRAPGTPFGWRLGAALPRLTRGWHVLTAGPIVFHYAPDQRADNARAASAGRFVDSVAALFAVRPPRRIDYFVTGSPDEYFRALGLDFFVLPSGRGEAYGGNALPDAGVLLAGDPTQGEAYFHELVHVVVRDRIRSGFVNEGAAAWLGGSRGRGAPQLFRALREFQRAHPDRTWAAVVGDKLSVPNDPEASSDAWYATGALMFDAVYRRRGLDGVRVLADAPRDIAGLTRLLARLLELGNGPAAIDRWWRGE